MKRIIVIGFQEYNEDMYPHLYEVLNHLKRSFIVHYIGSDERGELLYKAGRTTSFALRTYYLWKYRMNRSRIISKIKNVLRYESCDCIVAIDHTALSIAALFADKTKIYFWSHDFISSDRKWYYQSRYIQSLIRRNKHDIKKCSLIIIQDQNRADALNSILESKDIHNYMLPVSLNDSGVYKKNYTIDRNRRIVIIQMSSSIYKNTHLLIRELGKQPEKYELVFQGNIGISKKVIAASNVLVEARHKCKRIADISIGIIDADIAFLSYPDNDLNYYFISSASGQLAQYLMCGIPIIVYETPELNQWLEENQCGIYIGQMDNFDLAVDRILDNYELYSKNARDLYERHYDLELYIGSLIKSI